MPDEDTTEPTTETTSDQETTAGFQDETATEEGGGIQTIDERGDEKETNQAAELEDSSQQGKTDTDAGQDDGVDDGLMRWAADEGFSEDEVRSFGADNMRTILTRLDTKAVEAARQISGDGGRRREDDRRTTQDNGERATPEAPKRFQIDKAKLADIDPGVVEQIEALNDYYGGQLTQRDQYVSSLEEKLDGVVSAMQERQNMADLAEFDAALASLGDEFTDDFGKGSSLEIVPGTRAYNNRRDVLGVIGVLRQNNPGAPIAGFVPRAVNVVLSNDKVKKIARQEVLDKAKKASSKATGRGKTTRTTQKKSPEAEREEVMAGLRKLTGGE